MSIQTGTQGIIASAQGGTGASADSIFVGVNQSALVIQGASAAGASTWTIEQSLDGGSTWRPVITETPAVLSMAFDGVYTIDNPVGHYRTNVTGFVSAFTARFMRGPDAR